MLATRRTRPFAVRWSIGLGTIALVASIVPFVAPDPGAGDRAALERLATDTLRSAQRVRAAGAAVVVAESALAVARIEATRVVTPVRVAPRPVAVAPSGDVPPMIADLTRRIDDARRLRTSASYLEVAAHPQVSGGPRMRAFADSVRLLDATPDARDRDQRLGRFGVSMIAMARYRRDVLLDEAGIRPDSAAASRAPVDTPATPAQPAAPAATVAPPRDTLPLAQAWAAARDTLARLQRTHDSLTQVIRGADRGDVPPSGLGIARFLPAIAALALLVLGLALRFIAALRAELSEPTLADAAEAERLTGARALTTVRDAWLDGPARFKPSGVDPFRMLYLSLTATGTRARSALVAGPDPEIAAATGARLAIAAAADHRNTLIVDLDATSIALSRTFRERAEPGLNDVLARAFTWREVARPVGSSDGLPITLLPAGTERDDAVTGDARAALLAEFERLRATYELTLAVASLRDVELALSLLPASPVLLTAVAGETSIDALVRSVDAQRAAGRKVAGLVVWDAPRPALPTRAELAAELSKRKGRTPGGSFEAVRRAIDPLNKDNRRP